MVKKNIRKTVKWLRRSPYIVRSLVETLRHGGSSRIDVSIIERGKTLQGKRILITGGSSGIGLSIARKCLSEGAQVVITGRNQDKLLSVAQKLNNESLSVVVWDVGDVTLSENKLEEVERLLAGEIDVLVNNAGVLLGEAFPNISEKIWDQTYAVNSKGLFFLTQCVCKKWIQSKQRRTRKVLNISSQGGFVGATYPYRMTKWDVAGLTQGLGVKLADMGIIVNGIAPGVVVSDMQKGCQAQGENSFYSENPLKRHALPEEIAELAQFLISDVSNFIVGQTIVCDGGYSIK
jgi:NAD(P)-dependent dehydrogenase (short-subunit alcohol dehydrogenase family)